MNYLRSASMFYSAYYITKPLAQFIAQYTFGECMLDYHLLGVSNLVLYLCLLYTLGTQYVFKVNNGTDE